MHDIFNGDNTEGILLIHAQNSFNSNNRKVMLHNLKFICLVIVTYISNCYMCPAILLLISGGELLSKEGTTQSDPTSTGVYTHGILPVLPFLLDLISFNELNVRGCFCR